MANVKLSIVNENRRKTDYGLRNRRMINFADRTVTAVLLGNMQDGGLPHMGCRCHRCLSGTAYATALALVDTRQTPTAVYLFDATPDIKHQLALLANALGTHPAHASRLRQPDALFLTHAHLGHIGGLPQFGMEAMGAVELPVYASPQLCQLLSKNTLWQPLVQRLELRPAFANETVWLAEDVRITAVPVPHRDEWGAGAYAFRIQGPNRSLLYLPDIDDWAQWPPAAEVIGGVDVAIVDATFASRDELGGNQAPHPPVSDTLARFAHLPTQLVLTHINHSNPLLDADSETAVAVRAAGAAVAACGMQFEL